MFESLVEAYKNMDEIGKRKVLMEDLKKTIMVLQKVCEEKGILFLPITNKELLDLNDGKESFDDYLEAMFVYLKYLDELIGAYIEKTL